MLVFWALKMPVLSFFIQGLLASLLGARTLRSGLLTLLLGTRSSYVVRDEMGVETGKQIEGRMRSKPKRTGELRP